MSVRVLHGDCREVLKTLPDASVQCCVTSPPYWGLRDYGVAGQIGLEATPEEYVAEMVAVFHEVRRVLRDDGTLWLNLGDSYASGPNGRTLKPKDLIGIPWMVAFALRADGWWLRQDNIWAKRNCMPESVRDRTTRAHEYVFMLTKSAKYFYDAVAIEEDGDIPAGTRAAKGSAARASVKNVNGRPPEYFEYTGKRNKRTVWHVATQPFAEAHFATMPPTIVETCILAGTSEKGCCATCGAPWVRIVKRKDQNYDGSKYGERVVAASGGAKSGGTARSTLGSSNGKMVGVRESVGWAASCECECPTCEGGGLGPAEYAPAAPGGIAEACCKDCQGIGHPTPISCAILDPFGGAGTTGLVADRLGRDAILIELNADYAAIAAGRLTRDAGLFAEIASA